MHSLKRLWANFALTLLLGTLYCGPVQPVFAESVQQNAVTLRVDRTENILYLSTMLHFELTSVVEEALVKGIAVYFVAEVDVLRERWYWTNQKISSLRRNIRLAYHPLTRRWRLNVSMGDFVESSQGLALNQNFDNLQEALDAVKRMTPWRLADLAELASDAKQFVDFRFRLDLTQLPRPLQIGTLGQADWQIFISAKQDIHTDAIR